MNSWIFFSSTTLWVSWFCQPTGCPSSVSFPWLRQQTVSATLDCKHNINSSPLRVAYMRQWTGLALVQIVACRLFGSKPLSKPMLGCCKLDPKEQTSVKIESKLWYFHSKMRFKMSSVKVAAVSKGRWVDITYTFINVTSIYLGSKAGAISAYSWGDYYNEELVGIINTHSGGLFNTVYLISQHR